MADTRNGFIYLRDLTKVYHTGAGDFLALDRINAVFHEGEFTSVVGRSGSGKSTLMNMITGIDRPTQGKVVIQGQTITALTENQMARWRGKNLGIIFQFYQLLPVLSLLENVMLPMQLAGRGTAAQQRRRAIALLRQVGVAEFAHTRPNMVSGGHQQSTAIARAMANNPPILIADEPTGNLGTRAGENIMRIFQSLAKQGKTIIMVTHDRELAAYAQRTLTIADGRIVKDANGPGPIFSPPFPSQRADQRTAP
jgi:putative ABC transport system ATP-binding protein